jgi:CubicO group peptidase (beta-lactamase class C family)
MLLMSSMLLAPSAAAALSDFGQRVDAVVAPILAAQAQLYNTSYSLGLAHGRGTALGAMEVVALAAGVQDHRTNALATVNSTYPVGSANKPLTAVALMALDEAGLLSLDAPAHLAIDPFLLRHNGTTLLELFGNDSRVLDVTGRHLISMRAGLFDYAYALNEAWSLDPANNGVDLTPYDYLRNADMWERSMWYAPGEGGAYSSMSFVLAGFLLAATADAEADWDAYDMKTAWEGAGSLLSAGAKARLSAGLTFPRGACSDDARVVRQYYHTTHKLNSTHTGVHFRDMTQESCLNGWTMGNLAATPGAGAAFLYHWLVANATAGLGEALLPAARVAEMKTMQKMTTGCVRRNMAASPAVVDRPPVCSATCIPPSRSHPPNPVICRLMPATATTPASTTGWACSKTISTRRPTSAPISRTSSATGVRTTARKPNSTTATWRWGSAS